MSEESRHEEEQAPEATAEPGLSGDDKSGGAKTAVAALVLAVIATAVAAAAIYFQYQSRDAGAAAKAIDDVRSQMDAVESRIDELASRRQALNDRISELNGGQGKLGERIDNLFRQQKRDNIDWAVAEIEHLMVIAEHSLTLSRDLDTALAALKAADNRLRDLDEPGLTEVRRQLTADINALQSVEDVDISGLSLYLADLAGRVETLPLQQQEQKVLRQTAPEAPQQEESAPAWKRLASGIWHEIKSLVVITRSDKSGRALLMPEERYFLYQNLRLQLESARMAVLRRDTANFRESLNIVIEWLKQYFDTDSSAVGNSIQSLEKMSGLKLERDLPDISSSLETLSAWIKERARAAPSGNAEPSS